MWTVGRGGETANSSEIGGGRNLKVGQRGSRARRATDQRESGRQGKKGFQIGKGDLRSLLRWAWPALRGDAEELVGKHQSWENKDVPPGAAHGGASQRPSSWKLLYLSVLQREPWRLPS